MDDSPSQSDGRTYELGWLDHRGGPSSSSRLGMTDEGKGLRRGGKQRRVPGQAAARGQFALFDKGRALARWYQRHGAGSKGQGADGAKSRVIRVKGSASRGGGSSTSMSMSMKRKRVNAALSV